MARREPAVLSKNSNLRALTSIRGFAAWWVVLFHFRDIMPSWYGPGLMRVFSCGYVAVDLFFIMSGFVIALNYAHRLEDLRGVEVAHFLTFRLARIYPLHLFVLCLMTINPVALLLTGHSTVPDRYDASYFFLSLGLIQNWGFTNQLGWNIPAWSISTEWLAYLIFPAFVWSFVRLNRSRSWLLATTTFILILLGAGAHAAGGLGGDIQHFGILRCIFEFVTGTCLFYLTSCTTRHSWLSMSCLIAGILAVALFIRGWAPDYVVVPGGFVLLVYALSDQNTAAARILSWRGFEALGIISYSTYMSHFFVQDWVKFILVRPNLPFELAFPTALVLTFVASILLYHAVEVPGRLRGRALAERLIRIRSVGVR